MGGVAISPRFRVAQNKHYTVIPPDPPRRREGLATRDYLGPTRLAASPPGGWGKKILVYLPFIITNYRLLSRANRQRKLITSQLTRKLFVITSSRRHCHNRQAIRQERSTQIMAKSSAVWQFFKISPTDETKAICDECQQPISRGGKKKR